jgi:23S rRNA pseudouridine2605 synthase
MAKEENEKPRRTRTAKPKSEQAPEGETFHAPAQKGPKHFSFGSSRGDSGASFEKPRRERSSDDRPRRSEGESTFNRKPGKRFEGGERKFDKSRSDERPRYRSEDSADRPKRGRTDDKSFRESKPRFDSGDSSDKPRRRNSDNDRPFESRPRFSKGDSSERPFRKRNDSDRDARPARFDSRDKSDKPFRRKPEEGQASERPFRGRNDSDRDARPARFDSRDKSDKPFRRKPEEGESSERPIRRRNDSDRDARPARFDSRDKSDKPFRRKSEDGESGFSRRTSDREGFASDRPARRSGDKPTFERREPRTDKPQFESSRGETRSNDDKRTRRPDRDRTTDRPSDRRGGERKTRDEFKTTGEWLDPEDFKAEISRTRSRGKDKDGDELGYRPDYIPAPRREFRAPSKSKATLESKDGKIRLNKYIANAGICSRREADDLIQSGAIKVNGEIVTTLGFRVSPIDKIQYGDETLSREKKQYVLLNKPKDYITTANDPEGRKTVMELIKDACRERLYPVGRLDRATTGLLLMTNDGELAKRLMHPSHEMRKVYHVTLNKNLKAVDLKKIAEGLDLEDGRAEVDEVAWASQDNKEEVGVVLHSGKNRIVRRIFEHLGYEVLKLDRTGLAGLTKKNLPRGKFRFLTEKELIMLRMG